MARSDSYYKKWKRNHLTAEGRPKIAYPDLATAQAAAIQIQKDSPRSLLLMGYRCKLCSYCHVGSDHGAPFAPGTTWAPTWAPTREWPMAIELGERALACLILESHGRKGRRGYRIAQRFAAAEKRLLRRGEC